MKRALLSFVLLTILFSCKKEISHDLSNPSLLSSIMLQLQDSMANRDFQQLDFTKTVISGIPGDEHSTLRMNIYIMRKRLQQVLLLAAVLFYAAKNYCTNTAGIISTNTQVRSYFAAGTT